MRSEPPSPRRAVEVTVTVSGAPAAARLARWAVGILEAARVPGRELSVLVCGDARMRGLNRSFRKVDRPTDVLSFPAGLPGRARFLGDLAIDLPYARRQAAARGHSAGREVQILLVHGILHLLGFDHETDRGEMFARQARLVRDVFGPGPDGVPAREA